MNSARSYTKGLYRYFFSMPNKTAPLKFQERSFLYFYWQRTSNFHIWISKITIEILKKTNVVQVSTIVVISGAAIIAGSSFSFFAAIGSIHPISLDIITVEIIAKLTVTASFSGSAFVSV